MKSTLPRIIDSVLMGVVLLIKCNLFYNLGIFVDENGSSPHIVLGGEVWSLMDWFVLALLMIISISTVVNIFFKSKSLDLVSFL